MYISYCACKHRPITHLVEVGYRQKPAQSALSLRLDAAAAAIAVAVGGAEPRRQVNQAVGPQVDALGRGDGAAVVARADALLCRLLFMFVVAEGGVVSLSDEV